MIVFQEFKICDIYKDRILSKILDRNITCEYSNGVFKLRLEYVSRIKS